MKHQPIPGMCPFYDPKFDKCLATSSEPTPSSGTCDAKCKSAHNWQNCANYDAYRKGTYKGSPRL
jgi:hypothetical protein